MQPYNDNYVYGGTADTNRFSGQWIKHEAKGYLPWCYTYGKCVGDYGIDFTTYHGEAPKDDCGYWQYLTGADRSMILGGAGTNGGRDWAPTPPPGHYPVPQGADCLEREPILKPGYSDYSLYASATPVTDECRCLAPEELPSQCVSWSRTCRRVSWFEHASASAGWSRILLLDPTRLDPTRLDPTQLDPTRLDPAA